MTSEEPTFKVTVFGPQMVVYEEREHSCVVGPAHLKDYWLALTEEERADELAFKDALNKFIRDGLERRLATPLAGTAFETTENKRGS